VGKLSTSEKIDKVVTNRIAALPIFAAIMFLVYYISVSTVGTFVTDFMNDGVFDEGWSFFGLAVPGVPSLVTMGLEALNTPLWLNRLVLDGVVAGVGAVLGFVPQILVLFLFLSFLEACGYMSRIAFVLDRIFRKFGLSGKSFIPILVGTGCGVPGIMASRTIENERDRRMTIITTTFIPCGAKLPIIAMIAATLFGNAWWVAPLCYFVGIAAIIVSGIMLKKTKLFAGTPAPFVMELPAYHLPTFGNVMRATWERGWSFIKKAGTIIMLSTVIIWAGTVFGTVGGKFGFYLDTEGMTTVLDYIGSAISWLFVPLGFGEPTAAVATLMGLIAKEEVVAVFGVTDALAAFTPLSGFSFLVFNLLCAPCFAAMGAIRREMNNGKWTAFAIAYQCVFAYAISLIIYQFGLLFTGAMGGINILWLVIAALLAVGMLFQLFRPYKESGRLTQTVKIK
jgi:ferrous iron transport protein B